MFIKLQYNFILEINDNMFVSLLLFGNRYYAALVLFEQANCIDWIMFCYILSLTEI